MSSTGRNRNSCRIPGREENILESAYTGNNVNIAIRKRCFRTEI
jgi:hypothetical protein